MPQTLSRSEQARINGAKSKGPTTPKGKSASSKNAIKHGLTGGLNVVLVNETESEYQIVRQRWIGQLLPETDAERALVDRIAAAEWRLERIVLMQTNLMDYEIDSRAEDLYDNCTSLNEPGFLAVAFRDAVAESNAFDLLRRYETMLDRSIVRNVKLFHDLRDRRQAAAPAPEEPREETTPPSGPFPIGAVQNEPEPPPSINEINQDSPPSDLPKAA